MQQRSLLADLGREMRDIQSTLATIRRLDASAGNGASLPAQAATYEWVTSQLESHERLAHVVEETRILLAKARPPVDASVLQAVCTQEKTAVFPTVAYLGHKDTSLHHKRIFGLNKCPQ